MRNDLTQMRASYTRRRGAWVLFTWASLASVALWFASQRATEFRYPQVLAVGAAFLALSIVGLRLPSGDVVRIDVVAAVAALGVLSPFEGLASLAVGTAAGRLLSLQSKEENPLGVIATIARGVVALSLSYGLTSAARALGIPGTLPGQGVHTLLAAASYLLFDFVTLGLELSAMRSSRLSAAYSTIATSVGLLALGQACLGVALVLVFPYMREWSILVLTLLGAVLLNGFNLYLKVRVAYRETIIALARASELGMPERSGHANTVAAIAAVAAREARMSPREAEVLGYAALLHDIGMISWPDPDVPDSEKGVATAGAGILRDIPFLAGAAELIHADSAGARGGEDPGFVALGSEIIRLSSEFDSRMRAGGGRAGLQAVVSQIQTTGVPSASRHALELVERAVTRIYGAEQR